ncbi:unnamed protein product [Amoebophrya sp. A120]|nr:unnamed protein product [Amoebophrya sp. A120]|eukprot:GSA120T00026048001.1
MISSLQELYVAQQSTAYHPLERSPITNATQLAEEVKAEMRFCWENYRKQAWGYDEVFPVTGGGQNPLGGLGVTIVDSLDTLYLMGLHKEFREGLEFVRNELNVTAPKADFTSRKAHLDDLRLLNRPDTSGGRELNKHRKREEKKFSTFEITIRALGGLLSAYSLSSEKPLLQKAEQLGDTLLAKAFGDVGKANSRHGLFPVRMIQLAEKKMGRKDKSYGKKSKIQDSRQRKKAVNKPPPSALQVGLVNYGTDLVSGSNSEGEKGSSGEVDSGDDEEAGASSEDEEEPSAPSTPTAAELNKDRSGNLAEVGSLQLEFRSLAFFTKRQDFTRLPDKAVQALTEVSEHTGNALLPVGVNLWSKRGAALQFIGSRVSVGAEADSYYEYLLKQYLLGDKKDPNLREAFLNAMDAMCDKLVQRTAGDKQLLFIGGLDAGVVPDNKMEHLTCFVPGMLVLTLMQLDDDDLPLSDKRRKTYLKVATGVADTCYEMYRMTKTGLAPEVIAFRAKNDAFTDEIVIPPNLQYSLLRPEAAESFFYLHHFTNDPKYRLWAREIFYAMRKHAKTKFGYSGYKDVNKVAEKEGDADAEVHGVELPFPLAWSSTTRDSARGTTRRHANLFMNRQESFFLAETLKYLYLTFAPRNTLDLNKFVISTEAHPLLRFGAAGASTGNEESRRGRGAVGGEPSALVEIATVKEADAGAGAAVKKRTLSTSSPAGNNTSTRKSTLSTGTAMLARTTTIDKNKSDTALDKTPQRLGQAPVKIMVGIPTRNRVGYVKFLAEVLKHHLLPDDIPKENLYIVDDSSEEFSLQDLRKWFELPESHVLSAQTLLSGVEREDFQQLQKLATQVQPWGKSEEGDFSLSLSTAARTTSGSSLLQLGEHHEHQHGKSKSTSAATSLSTRSGATTAESQHQKMKQFKADITTHLLIRHFLAKPEYDAVMILDSDMVPAKGIGQTTQQILRTWNELAGFRRGQEITDQQRQEEKQKHPKIQPAGLISNGTAGTSSLEGSKQTLQRATSKQIQHEGGDDQELSLTSAVANWAKTNVVVPLLGSQAGDWWDGVSSSPGAGEIRILSLFNPTHELKWHKVIRRLPPTEEIPIQLEQKASSGNAGLVLTRYVAEILLQNADDALHEMARGDHLQKIQNYQLDWTMVNFAKKLKWKFFAPANSLLFHIGMHGQHVGKSYGGREGGGVHTEKFPVKEQDLFVQQGIEFYYNKKARADEVFEGEGRG